MNKILLVVLLKCIPLLTFGQAVFSDSLLYYLVGQTIEKDSRILKHVIIPEPSPDTVRLSRTMQQYFNKEDVDFISNQLSHPVIREWDKRKFPEDKNIKIVKRFKNSFSWFGIKSRDTWFIDLPVFSKDMKTVLLSYTTMHKYLFHKQGSMARIVAIWKIENGQWKLAQIDLAEIS